MIITVANKAGACYGVNRALELALGCKDALQPVHTLGPLIHNPIFGASMPFMAASTSLMPPVPL